MLKELQEIVKISKPVVSDQQNVQEFELLNPFDITQLVVLAVDLFRTEVCGNTIQGL